MLEQILNTLLSVPGIIFAFTLKGFSQAFVAKKLGDPTPEAQDRLTMNPMAHIDLIGFIFLLLFKFGWHKPVITNSRYYKNVKRDKAIQILSGPVGLIVGAFVLSFFYILFEYLFFLFIPLANETVLKVFEFLYIIFMYATMYPLFLAVFYMLPLPGLDGYNLIANFLPYKWNNVLYNIEKYSIFIFMGFIILMDVTPLGAVIQIPSVAMFTGFSSLWRTLLGFIF